MVVINVMVQLGFVKKPYYFLIALLIACVLGYISYSTIGSFSRKKKLELNAA